MLNLQESLPFELPPKYGVVVRALRHEAVEGLADSFPIPTREPTKAEIAARRKEFRKTGFRRRPTRKNPYPGDPLRGARMRKALARISIRENFG